jgi:hypothetical protein
MRAAILSRLRGDSVLAALLPGGIFDAAEVDYVSKHTTPGAFDGNIRVRPCALLRLSGDRPLGPFRTSSQLTATLYLYQRRGTDAIEPARLRIKQLLHRVRLSPDAGGAWEITSIGDDLGQTDAALDCPLIICRYRIPVRSAELAPAAFALLLEDGSALLLEDGARLLLEA